MFLVETDVIFDGSRSMLQAVDRLWRFGGGGLVSGITPGEGKRRRRRRRRRLDSQGKTKGIHLSRRYLPRVQVGNREVDGTRIAASSKICELAGGGGQTARDMQVVRCSSKYPANKQ